MSMSSRRSVRAQSMICTAKELTCERMHGARLVRNVSKYTTDDQPEVGLCFIAGFSPRFPRLSLIRHSTKLQHLVFKHFHWTQTDLEVTRRESHRFDLCCPSVQPCRSAGMFRACVAPASAIPLCFGPRIFSPKFGMAICALCRAADRFLVLGLSPYDSPISIGLTTRHMAGLANVAGPSARLLTNENYSWICFKTSMPRYPYIAHQHHAGSTVPFLRRRHHATSAWQSKESTFSQ